MCIQEESIQYRPTVKRERRRRDGRDTTYKGKMEGIYREVSTRVYLRVLKVLQPGYTSGCLRVLHT